MGEAWASVSEIATRQLNKARKGVMLASECNCVREPANAPQCSAVLPLEGTTRLNPEMRVFATELHCAAVVEKMQLHMSKSGCRGDTGSCS